jgi:hypothetical protein
MTGFWEMGAQKFWVQGLVVKIMFFVAITNLPATVMPDDGQCFSPLELPVAIVQHRHLLHKGANLLLESLVSWVMINIVVPVIRAGELHHKGMSRSVLSGNGVSKWREMGGKCI